MEHNSSGRLALHKDLEDGAPVPQRARSASAKARVRDSLIAAGRALFASQEFADVSLRQIAKEAGYSAGVVYKYFPDRDALFRAIRDVELTPYADELTQVFEQHDEPEQRILAMTRLASAFATRSAKDFGIRFIYSTNTLEATPGADTKRSQGVDSSPVSLRIHQLQKAAAAAFLDSLPQAPVDSGAAANVIIASIAGMAVLPGTPSAPQVDRAALTQMMVKALLCYWRAESAKLAAAKG